MTNMSYCRFENTYYDLKDCLYALQEGEELSETEQQFCRKLIKVAKQIISIEGDDE